MHSILIWPVLTILAGTVATAPTLEDAGNRSLVYWMIVPSLLVAFAAICACSIAF